MWQMDALQRFGMMANERNRQIFSRSHLFGHDYVLHGFHCCLYLLHVPNLSARPLMLGCEHHWFLWQHMQRIPQAAAFPNFLST